MTIALAPTETLAGSATNATTVNYTLNGDEATTSVDAFKTLSSGQLAAALATIYTAPAGVGSIVKVISLFNTGGTNQTVALAINGTSSSRKIWTGTLPAGGSATYGDAGWRVYDANGVVQSVGSTGPAATIAVGTVTNIGTAGPPTVTNVGTSTAATFNFGLQQGATGPTGPAGAVASIGAGSSKVTIAGTTSIPTVDVVPANFTGIPETGVTNLSTDLARIGLVATATKTANYTAQPGEFVMVDPATAGAPVTITAPPLVAGTRWGVRLTSASAFAVTASTGSGTFDTNGTSTLGLATGFALLDVTWTGNAAGTQWVGTSSGKPNSYLSSLYAAVGEPLAVKSVGGTAPIVSSGGLTPALSITAASTSAAGSMSALDKKKTDNLYYDVTANSIAVLDNTGTTDNASAWATLFAGLPVGATVYFPAGTYNFASEATISADKHLVIRGAGEYVTTLKAITSTTASIFHINGQYWFNTFADLGFDSSAVKTAGAAIEIDPGAGGNAVGIDVRRCYFTNQFIGVWAHAVYSGGTPGGAANISVWDSLNVTSPRANGRGIKIDSGNANLVVTNSTMNCGGGSGAVSGSACVEINASGAVQFVGNDFIGGANTVLLNGTNTGGASSSVAAVLFTNCFLDQSGGSTLKITGGQIVNRVKFVQCGITGGNVAGAIAVEVASTGTGGAGTATAAADGIDFFDCDIYPNGGTGTINGIQITGAQGVAIQSCRISGWTNGVAVTPAVSAGYTKISLIDNKFGATNNFTTPNTVGVLLNAGSFTYGGVTIQSNDFTGSTTPITDNSTINAGNNKNVGGNIGIASPGGLSSLPTAAQALTASADNLIVGTSVALATGQLRIGSRFRFACTVTRTTAGTVAWSAKVKFGTANTNADAAVATFTSGTNTAAADQAVFIIEWEVTAVGASATGKATCFYANSATTASGLTTLPLVPTSTAAFNANATSPFLHLDVTPGTSYVMTAIGSAEMLA